MLSLGEKISIARKKMKLNQEELADMIEASRPSISQWENNKVCPDTDKLRRLASALNLSIAYLMGETEDPSPAAQTAIKNNPLVKSNVHFEIADPVPADQVIVPVLSLEQSVDLGRGKSLSEITEEKGEKILIPKKDLGMLSEGRMPFAIIIDGSMKRWGIKDGSRVVINPAEEAGDFDIALVCYKDKLAVKKLQRIMNGKINLISSDGVIITVPEEDACTPDLFSIWGKAMTYTYKESGKIKHGL